MPRYTPGRFLSLADSDSRTDSIAVRSPFCIVPTLDSQTRPTELKSLPTATELQRIYVRKMVDRRTLHFRIVESEIDCHSLPVHPGHSSQRYVAVTGHSLGECLHDITLSAICQALFSDCPKWTLPDPVEQVAFLPLWQCSLA